MNLLDSLLDAIVRLEGDALVMHVGEKPYVVTASSAMNAYRGPLAWGQVELSSRVLTCDAVLGMLGQILPLEQRQALEELGAIEHHVPIEEGSTEQFTVVAARGGDDVWLEVRRHRPEPKSAEIAEPAAAEVAEPVAAEDAQAPAVQEQPAPVEEPVMAPVVEEPVAEPVIQIAAEEAPVVVHAAEETPAVAEVEPVLVENEPEIEIPLDDLAAPATAEAIAEAPPEEEAPFEIVHEVGQDAPTNADVDELFAATTDALLRSPTAAPQEALAEAEPEAEEVVELGVEDVSAPVLAEEAEIVLPVEPEPEPAAVAEAPEPEPQPEPVLVAQEPVCEPEPEPALVAQEPEPEPRAVVVPLSRSPIHSIRSPQAHAAGSTIEIDELLRVAAARGASAVYVVAQSEPMVRTDGEISALEIGNGGPLTQEDVERIVLELAPPAKDGVSREPAAEWMCDVPGVGRVRCLTFHDHRGPGVILRMIPPRAISADQLGLSAEVQALCSQADGLVLVTGARASGKTTLMNAFVDLINRTRSDHVITVEPQIGFVHESRRCFVSQREVRGDAEATLAALRAALREGPDVVFIEDVRTGDMAGAALQAAEGGRLVFASIGSPSAPAAVERFLEFVPADRRAQAQASLGSALRGVVSQVLVRRAKGGRLAAREVLLNTPAIGGLIQEGRLNQLPRAMEGGRRLGMVVLSDALASLVRDGTVHVTEAYRKAIDKEALLAALKREGVDTSFAERLA